MKGKTGVQLLKRITKKNIQMENIYNLSIETAKNGYIVNVNTNYIDLSGKAKPVPFVFETMDNLINFIKENLKL